MKNLPQRMLIALMGIFLFAATAMAQVSTGTVLGIVTDASGARIPGVTITLQETKTGISTSFKTDGSGIYNATSLPIGTYTMEAAAAGFKTAQAGPFELTVGKQQTIDFTMQPGAVTETVTVAADVPQVETSDTSIGFLIGSDQVQNLPLNGRDLTQLVLLAPGVQPVPQEDTEGGSTLVPFGFGSPQRFSVAGGRPQGQLFLLDGTDTAGVWGNGTGVNLAGTSLGVDAVQEFEALTNTYNAQYGGNGGVVNSVLRAGTNNWHGSVYEFFRNNALDARNFNDPVTGTLPFNRNQFGATFGGPIYKDRTFFFVNYEGFRQQLTTPITTAVPDANFRMGILPCDQTNLCTSGNVNVGIAPGIASYLAAAPLPNVPGSDNDGVAENVSNLNSPVNENFGVAKLTHNLSSTDSLSASYVIDNGVVTSYPDPTLQDLDTQRNQYYTVEERKIFSPTFLNVAHVSYVRSNINVSTLVNPAFNIVPTQPYNGTIDIAGLSTIGGSDDAQEVVNRYTFRDQVSLTKGRHTLDAGMEVVYHQVNVSIPIINGGEAVYETFCLKADPNNPANCQVDLPAYQGFLSGVALAFAGVPNNADDSRRDMRHTNLSPYVQDKFTINSRVTLNAGLRYDFETNPTETRDKLYNLIDPQNPNTTGFTHVPSAFRNNITRFNFEPRVGLAWDVTGDHKTSLRAGFGIFDDLPLEMQTAIAYLFNPPIYDVTTILFPQIPNPFGSGLNATGLPGGAQLTSYTTKMNDYIMQYNLVVQHQLPHNTVATLGYIGSRANHLFIGQETNSCIPVGTLPDGRFVRDATCSNGGTTKPGEGVYNPNLSSVVMRYPNGSSNYNSMQVAIDKGVGTNLQFRTAYTWSKCMDIGSYYTGNDSIGPNGQTFGLQAGSIAANHGYDYGPCDYDLRNNWVNNAIWALPFQGNRFKEGWQLTAIGQIHSGTPYTVYDGIDQAYVGDSGAANNAERPDLVGPNANPTSIRHTGGSVYGFDSTSFALQAPGVFGNLGRNTLVAPTVGALDFGISKITKIGETRSLKLTAEAFNITNHTDYGFPNALMFLPNGARNPFAGQITAYSIPSRQIQFSGKFTF